MSTNKPAKKKTRPPFVPTQEQRDFIDEMAGMHMTVTDIALAIGVSRRTLYKYFRSELEAGSARLHALVTSQFYKALKAGAPWAVQVALRNLQWKWDRYDKNGTPFIANNDKVDEIKITFVTPSRKDKPPPIDVTPPASPYENGKPNYDMPAIEPPRPRAQTATGAIFEEPREARKPEPDPDWPWPHLPKPMPPNPVDNRGGGQGEPPSAFGAKSDPNGWMR